jgi:hypothetical protein
MSIKHKIKFKNPVVKELRAPKYKSKVVEDKTKYNRKNKTIWINEDEEYAKHLTKFFKGEVE